MVDQQTFPGMVGERFEMKIAIVSPCGKYRYTLERLWGTGPTLLIVMLNPSTADAQKDDQTIRRCRHIAQLFGYGAMKVVNLFAYRTKSPKDLKASVGILGILGPNNDEQIAGAARDAEAILVAWGNHGSFLGRDSQVRRILLDNKDPKTPVYCIAMTRRCQPMHPLYAPSGCMMDFDLGARCAEKNGGCDGS